MFPLPGRPAPDQRPLWCMICGAPAAYLTNSTDPTHPVGLCSGRHTRTARALCSYDWDEVVRLQSNMAATRKAQAMERQRVYGRGHGS